MKRYLKNFSLAIPFLFVGIAALVACDFTQESSNIHQALSNLMNDLHLGLIPLVLLGCTRAIYVANQETKSIFTVRSMDWSDPNIPTSLWASPRGSDRTAAGESDEGYPHTWKSQYKSVVVCNYNKSATDGINEKGLVANLLFLLQADYTHHKESQEKPRLPITALAQYVLDNYATVKEAVDDLKQDPFFIVTSDLAVAMLDKNSERFNVYLKKIVLHLSISDSKGDSAVFQYVKDEPTRKSKLIIYYLPDKEKVKGQETLNVLTNGLLDKQLDLLKQFQNKNKNFNWGDENEVFSWDDLKKYNSRNEEVKEMNPPMNGADIRFVRASFYSNMLDKIDNDTKNKRPFIDETQRVPGKSESYKTWVEDWSKHEGLARAFSLIRNMSTPLNVQAIDDNPFLASTVWRTVVDHGNKRYFFELNRALYPVYVDLEELFADLETVKKLDLYVPPAKEGDTRIDLLEDQLNKGEKIGKVNHLFEDVKDNKWFYFDYQKP
ncbi:linear amide C-N hydrolase [Nostoc sp. CENA67]|uniref:Linear amide C-N hydrolase n=1 Tax=Amazonocrinis nigriterrae CENA67 TaxID=2794033 RepID=A0A8J7HSA6_9NOST|nr:linear amide C-N hydrolase [Amazonocrinis nigriterrae]MBH8562610.1 linear amide C-N hydrolase [Amazonocrinis nigriterrae CENA67]